MMAFFGVFFWICLPAELPQTSLRPVSPPLVVPAWSLASSLSPGTPGPSAPEPGSPCEAESDEIEPSDDFEPFGPPLPTGFDPGPLPVGVRLHVSMILPIPLPLKVFLPRFRW